MVPVYPISISLAVIISKRDTTTAPKGLYKQSYKSDDKSETTVCSQVTLSLENTTSAASK